jgi:hypothetical protein
MKSGKKYILIFESTEIAFLPKNGVIFFITEHGI